jgi:hypothetical protein
MPAVSAKSKKKSTYKTKPASISKARTLKEQAEFWDTHDTADYPAEWVEFEVAVEARRHYVAVDPDILVGVRRVAHARGLSTESLVNLWLQERLAVATARKASKAA